MGMALIDFECQQQELSAGLFLVPWTLYSNGSELMYT